MAMGAAMPAGASGGRAISADGGAGTDGVLAAGGGLGVERGAVSEQGTTADMRSEGAAGERGPEKPTVVEVKHAVRRALEQFQAAGVAQLADELHDRGQADAVERTLQLNHVLDRAGASARNGAEVWPTPRLRVANPCCMP